VSLLGRPAFLVLLIHKSFLGHTLEDISDLLTLVADIPAQSTLHASSCGDLIMLWTHQLITDTAFSVAACYQCGRGC